MVFNHGGRNLFRPVGIAEVIMQISNAAPIMNLATAVIASGASVSSAVKLAGTMVSAIQMPAAWTAASITVQGSYDGVTYFNLFKDDGTELSATVAVNQQVIVAWPDLASVRYLKLRSGTAALAVAQGGARSINVITQ